MSKELSLELKKKNFLQVNMESTEEKQILRKGVDYIIRPMRVEDLPGLHALLTENQWNMDLDYLQDVMSTDPSGLQVVTDSKGQIIGHNGFLPFGSLIAAFGMNILKDGWRGKGLGKKLFQSSMKLFEDRNVGMLALSNRVSFYRQFGWCHESYTCHYNQGPVNPDFIASPPTGDFKLVQLSDVSFDDLVHYDAGIHTVPRHRFLSMWTKHKKASCFVATQDGKIVGYCVLRPADVGWRMYPLFADSDVIARALFCKAGALIPKGEDLIFTHPVENANATAIVKANGLTNYLSMTRLYNKWVVTVDISRVYSVSSTDYALA